jgi:hypothetical protein
MITTLAGNYIRSQLYRMLLKRLWSRPAHIMQLGPIVI